jgi:NFU1 iron-sulfur cluster scaffold homolog, mitochondrial
MPIQFQPTPNPNAGKFALGRPSVPAGGSRSYSSREQAAGDALAGPLFDLPGVVSVFMVADFVTVTKAGDASWDELVPRVIATLEAASA